MGVDEIGGMEGDEAKSDPRRSGRSAVRSRSVGQGADIGLAAYGEHKSEADVQLVGSTLLADMKHKNLDISA